ncbi:MAG: hypothetical protein KBT03_04735 [Bacteroidales bacterium]|nr:hypothetical protein [Candidatus Scybalousia scybalohippi]
MTQQTFKNVISANQLRYAVDNKELSEALGVSERTARRYKSSIDEIKVKDLRTIINLVHVQDEDLLSFLKRG